MARYRKKPVVIEAVSVRSALHAATEHWGAMPPWLSEAYERGEVLFAKDHVRLTTLECSEGTHRADLGDMIIRGVRGELYSCKSDVFEATYEKVEE